MVNRDRGLFLEGEGAYSIKQRRWYLFYIESYKMEKLKYKKLEVKQPRIKNKLSKLPILVNKPSRISRHKVLQL